jgi:flagellin
MLSPTAEGRRLSNAQNRISMLQPQMVPWMMMTNIVQRMKVLATQSANDTYSAEDRTAMDAEFNGTDL